MDFDNIIICVKSDKMYNIYGFCNLRRYLFTNFDFFERQGNKFSHICELNVTFISGHRNMTYEHYLKQPEQLIEGVFSKKSNKNPELLKTFKIYPIL